MSRPSVELWLRRIRDRKAASETQVLPSEILRARDQERTGPMSMEDNGGGNGPVFEELEQVGQVRAQEQVHG